MVADGIFYGCIGAIAGLLVLIFCLLIWAFQMIGELKKNGSNFNSNSNFDNDPVIPQYKISRPNTFNRNMGVPPSTPTLVNPPQLNPTPNRAYNNNNNMTFDTREPPQQSLNPRALSNRAFSPEEDQFNNYDSNRQRTGNPPRSLVPVGGLQRHDERFY